MKHLVHIVNLANFPDASPLHFAQAVTVETMRMAKALAASTLRVTLLSAQFKEDRTNVPVDFEATSDLERSVLDIGEFKVKRRLPLLVDILDRAYAEADCDYLIYSNVDIALLPNFYLSIDRAIDRGFDAFAINRRTISKSHVAIDEIPLMFAEIGRPHPGYDCFVVPRVAYQHFKLGKACIGAGYVGKIMILNQILNANRFAIFRDWHLTFHIGDDRPWAATNLRDYRRHNRQEFEEIMRGLTPALRRQAQRSLRRNRLLSIRDQLLNILRFAS